MAIILCVSLNTFLLCTRCVAIRKPKKLVSDKEHGRVNLALTEEDLWDRAGLYGSNANINTNDNAKMITRNKLPRDPPIVVE